MTKMTLSAFSLLLPMFVTSCTPAIRPPAASFDAGDGVRDNWPSPPEWTDTSPHQIRFVTVAADVQLEVLDWGGTGTPLVFLAGLSHNAHTFDDFAPRFTDEHRVIGITRRGHGASSWPTSGFEVDRLAEDIRIVLDSLGFVSVILVGHSYAGTEMTQLAIAHPDRVDGLIYLDAAHDYTRFAQLGLPGPCPPGPRLDEALAERSIDPEPFVRTQLRVDSAGVTRPYFSRDFMMQFERPDYARLRVPALAVYFVPERVEDIFASGDEPSDECVSAAQRYMFGTIAAFAEDVPGSRIVVMQSQHNLHLFSPDELEEAMRRWLLVLRRDDPERQARSERQPDYDRIPAKRNDQESPQRSEPHEEMANAESESFPDAVAGDRFQRLDGERALRAEMRSFHRDIRGPAPLSAYIHRLMNDVQRREHR